MKRTKQLRGFAFPCVNHSALRYAMCGGVAVIALVCGCTVDLELCPPADEQTMGLYLFDEGGGATVRNRAPTDAPDGKITTDAVTREPGPCGGAVLVPLSAAQTEQSSPTDAYAVVPSAAPWDLRAGSVELWVRFDPMAGSGPQGILSRDAKGQDSSGHFELLRLYENRRNIIAARVQDDDETTHEQHFCSAVSFEDGVWHRIAVDFGGAQRITLCVDGEPVDRRSGGLAVTADSNCGVDTPGGLAGNDEPWVIGANAAASEPSSDAPAYGGLGGAIASLRISGIRRGCGDVVDGPTGTTPWDAQLGTAADDKGHGVVVDPQGNVYVTGFAGGDLTDANGDPIHNAGDKDIVTLKYDSTGRHLWTRLLGSAASDMGIQLALDAEGNVYVTGFTEGDLPDEDGNPIANAGGEDVFVCKYDGAGKLLWTRMLGTASDERGYGIATGPEGNVYITGPTDGDLDPDGDIAKPGEQDAFIAKFDAAGQRLWTTLLGSPDSDSASNVAIDSEGNAYIVGITYDSVDGRPNRGKRDYFISKHDKDGIVLWTVQGGSDSRDHAQGIAVDSHGDVYITGHTAGQLGDSPRLGDSDLFIAKYDTDGIAQWTKQDGTSRYDHGAGIAVDAHGNIYVAGTTGGELHGHPNTGDWDMFIAAYDAAGNWLWTELRGSSAQDENRDVAIGPDGSVFSTGHVLGALGGHSHAGDNDIFVWKPGR